MADSKDKGADDLMTEAEENAEVEKVNKHMATYGGQCNTPGCTCGGWVGGINITKCRRRGCRHGADYHF